MARRPPGLTKDGKKRRKPRGIKKDGTRSLDLCSGCYSFGCDPFSMSPKFREKVNRRLAAGQCVACGQPKDNCKCKSSLG